MIYITTPEWSWDKAFILLGGTVLAGAVALALAAAISWIVDKYNARRHY